MRPVNRLPRWQRLTAEVAGAALLASGIVWLLAHYGGGAVSGDLPHPAEPWMMRLHGGAAMAALFALGLLAAGHVPHGWRVTATRHGRRQRRLGLALLALAAAAVGSGYLLYYFVPERWRGLIGGLHSAAGLVMAALLVWHRRHRMPRA
jgi:hypothetical protein